jgi:hypothetical protein
MEQPEQRLKQVVVQQPQFLPWIGMWHKAVSADVLVHYVGVKFDQYDHMHRVTLAGAWMTLPVEKHSRNRLIKDVRISDAAHCRALSKALQDKIGRKARFFDRLAPVFSRLDTWRGLFLADLSTTLFDDVRQILGMNLDIRVDDTDRTGLDKVPKLDTCLQAHFAGQSFIYLQGAGGLNYMGHQALKVPRETRFQRVNHGLSPDTVLTLIATDPDPLTAIKACACWVGEDNRIYRWDGTNEP